MQIEIRTYAELARTILSGTTPYSAAKRTIQSLFESPPKLPYLEAVALRLTVVDSYYSTNMSKRYYGIEDIAVSLQNIGPSDDQLSIFFRDYIQRPLAHEEGRRLFAGVYGINKKGDQKKRAQSLISKYGYFQTRFQFPIYDSLAKQSYRRLSIASPIQVPTCKRLDDPGEFFAAISKLNAMTHDFDLLDNLLWLIGKVKEASLSLVVSRKAYLKLLSCTSSPMTYDLLVKIGRSKTEASSVLGKDLCAFIAFTRSLP
jgi:hypothetical protein